MLQHFHTIYVSNLDIIYSLKKDQNTGNRNVIEVEKTLKIIYENLKETIVNIIKEKVSDESGVWKEKVW